MTSTAPPSWPAPEFPERPEGVRPPEPKGPAAWPAWIAPVAFVAGFVGALVGGTILVLIAAVFGADLDDTPPGILLGATVVQDASLVAAAILFARLSGPVFSWHFGLRAPRSFWQSVGLVFAVYIGFAIFAAIWGALVGTPDDEPLLDDLGVDENTALLVSGMLVVCVLAPLVEEFFFRGFFYRAVSNRVGVAGGAVVTGLVFSVVHATSSPVEHLVPLAVLGAMFCLLYHWTGSLYPCIALHAINNSIAFSYAQDWTWQYAPLILGALTLSLGAAIGVGRRWSARALA